MRKVLTPKAIGRQTDRRTGKQIGGLTVIAAHCLDQIPERQTDRQTERQTDRERERETERHTD